MKAQCRNLGIGGVNPQYMALLAGSKLEFRQTLLLAGFPIGIWRGALCIWKAHCRNLGIRGANYGSMLH
jgi:hypothetical protein